MALSGQGASPTLQCPRGALRARRGPLRAPLCCRESPSTGCGRGRCRELWETAERRRPRRLAGRGRPATDRRRKRSCSHHQNTRWEGPGPQCQRRRRLRAGGLAACLRRRSKRAFCAGWGCNRKHPLLIFRWGRLSRLFGGSAERGLTQGKSSRFMNLRQGGLGLLSYPGLSKQARTRTAMACTWQVPRTQASASASPKSLRLRRQTQGRIERCTSGFKAFPPECFVRVSGKFEHSRS